MKTKNNIITLVTTIARKLEVAYFDPLLCEQYAWWIIENITHRDKAALLTHETLTLTPEQQTTLDEWLAALIDQKMPIQYLIGSVPFDDVAILVKPPILIPRPETEEWCIALINQLQYLENKQLTILDLCCGSGCIAVALAKALPQATMYATDISPQALDLAQKNAEHNNVSNINFMQSDLFTAIPKNVQFDLIVCNPPYVSFQEWDSMDDSVTAWEDRLALVADDNGLALIKKIIQQAPAYIKTNEEMKQRQQAQLILEIGYLQGSAVKELMKQHQYNHVIVHKDLEGKDRVVSGRVDSVAISKTSG